MKLAKQKNRTSIQAQRGAALVIGLIMLLLLTLIGVAGMKDTLLQQKMVANAKDREMALQAAESALRAAEIMLSGPAAPAMTGPGKYDLDPTPPSQVMRLNKKEAEFWRGYNWTSATSMAYGFALDGVVSTSPPQFVIEKLNVALSDRSGYPSGASTCTRVCSEDLMDDWTPPVSPVSDYRITARAVGSTTNAVVLLQSTFRRDRP